jgi:hypothetical protein
MKKDSPQRSQRSWSNDKTKLAGGGGGFFGVEALEFGIAVE